VFRTPFLLCYTDGPSAEREHPALRSDRPFFWGRRSFLGPLARQHEPFFSLRPDPGGNQIALLIHVRCCCEYLF